ncbi:MAG: YbbR-like domain-containing protein [Tannerella sp.]|nr:YbbR-like domain-containing protein [Tannerella sp.]
MEMEIVLPVKYKQVPANIILTDDNPVSILFRVKDKGLVMLNYSWLCKFAPLEVNLKNLSGEDSAAATVSRKTIESCILKQLTSSTALLGFEPQTVEVHYAELQRKELPVVAELSVSPEQGFQLADSMTVTPARVSVFASRTVLDTLRELRTVRMELKNVNRTQTVTLRLREIAGVQMDEDEVEVTAPVEEFTEKRLTIPVLCTGLPENYTLHLFPSTVEVVCNVPVSRFKDVSENDFEIRMPFEEFEANRTAGKLPVRLNKQPSWITYPALNPETVEFIIEQNN